MIYQLNINSLFFDTNYNMKEEDLHKISKKRQKNQIISGSGDDYSQDKSITEMIITQNT